MPTDTADRLKDAVLAAMREHGYAGTSMQDLLRSTGVSSSSMYHFFPGGKEALVAAAVRSSGAASAGEIAAVMTNFDPPTAITRIFDAAAAEMASHDFTLGCPIGVPATEAPTTAPEVQEAVAEVFDAWADAYASGLRAHGFDAATSDSIARAIIAVYEGSVTVARATRSTEPYRDGAALLISRLRPNPTSEGDHS